MIILHHHYMIKQLPSYFWQHSLGPLSHSLPGPRKLYFEVLNRN